MKLLKKRNFIILGLIIVLIGVFYLVDWGPQPVKVVDHYLMSVQKKDAEDAYQLLYIQDSNSNMDLERFKGTVHNDPLIEYKINGSSKINEKTYHVSVNVNMDGWNTDHTFEVRKIDGNWKIVF